MSDTSTANIAVHLSRRVTDIPPYLFAAIDKARDEAKANGLDVISLGIGDPDQPTLEPIVTEMHAAIDRPANHRYPAYAGSQAFREAAARWMQRRFGIEMDPVKEVIALIGAKEGIMHFSMAILDPGDTVLVPEPSYPTYRSSAQCMGAEIIDVPLTIEHDFQIDLASIPDDVADRAKLIWVNYPNNPTTAVAKPEFFEELVAWSHKHNVIVVNDNAYSEIYFDPNDRPISIFQIPGAKETCLELFSMSKGFNMTGWRCGWAAGNADLVGGLATIKSNVDSGVFTAIQEASIVGLDLPFESQDHLRNLYRERSDRVIKRLTAAGFEIYPCRGTIYVWCKVPTSETSIEYASRLLRETGVVVGPGSGWGPHGEGFFRMCMSTADDRLDEAVSRMVADAESYS